MLSRNITKNPQHGTEGVSFLTTEIVRGERTEERLKNRQRYILFLKCDTKIW